MAKILVVFGSRSDARVYKPLIGSLDDFVFKVCSAHRTPDFLDKILKTYYNVIVAGAGLSAHLPGVIASKTIRPVIGVPVSGKFDGLDALLSIIQMPPGIPVMSVGVDNSKEASFYAKLILKKYNGVNIIKNDMIDLEKIEKIEEILTDFNVDSKMSKDIDPDAVNIDFIEPGKTIEQNEQILTINVPVLDNSKAKDSLKLFKSVKTGLWVGVNRFENAALSCVQILNEDSRYTKKLKKLRERKRKKILGLKENK
ncbi:hypothetical protein GF327_08935 [Candidatus Woesearchaeota archaeon]|nr:hypothetical protein [Candidatus Woesearchaeota archaeon]